METSNQPQLTENAKALFGNKKNAQLNGYTIKWYISTSAKNVSEIIFMIFRGKGTGVQITSTSNFEDAVKFTNTPSVYRIIYRNGDNARGGAYFKANTDDMIFSTHPFNSVGWHF